MPCPSCPIWIILPSSIFHLPSVKPERSERHKRIVKSCRFKCVENDCGQSMGRDKEMDPPKSSFNFPSFPPLLAFHVLFNTNTASHGCNQAARPTHGPIGPSQRNSHHHSSSNTEAARSGGESVDIPEGQKGEKVAATLNSVTKGKQRKIRIHPPQCAHPTSRIQATDLLRHPA